MSKKSKVAKKVMEEVILEGKSMGQAMRDNGLSESYSRNPDTMKKTDSWQRLLEQNMPEKLIARIHKRQLKKRKLVKQKFPASIDDEDIEKALRRGQVKPFKIELVEEVKGDKFYKYKLALGWEYDDMVIDRALDKYYKVAGKYKESLSVENTTDLDNMTMEELEEVKKKIEEGQSLIMERYKKYGKKQEA